MTKLSLRTIDKFFRKNFFSTLFTVKKILKVTKFQFKIICCPRVLDKNIPLWYNVPSPGANRVNNFLLTLIYFLNIKTRAQIVLATERRILFQTRKTRFLHKVIQCATLMCTESETICYPNGHFLIYLHFAK